MQARTLTGRATKLLGTECRHCHRVLSVGDQVVTHYFGRDAPWDLKTFTVHAACARKVLNRLADSSFLLDPPTMGERAAQFRQVAARVGAGGPLFDNA